MTQGLVFWPNGLVESLNWLVSLVGLLSTGRAGFVAVYDCSYHFPVPCCPSGMPCLFQRRRIQLLGLMVFLNLLSGFDFDVPISPNGLTLIDRVGNILISNFVDFALYITSVSPKR